MIKKEEFMIPLGIIICLSTCGLVTAFVIWSISWAWLWWEYMVIYSAIIFLGAIFLLTCIIYSDEW